MLLYFLNYYFQSIHDQNYLSAVKFSRVDCLLRNNNTHNGEAGVVHVGLTTNEISVHYQLTSKNVTAKMTLAGRTIWITTILSALISFFHIYLHTGMSRSCPACP